MPIPALAALGYKAFEQLGGADWAMKRLGLKKDVYDKFLYNYKGFKPVFNLEDGMWFVSQAALKHYLRTKNAKKIDVFWYHVQDIPANEGSYQGVVKIGASLYDANLWGVDARAYGDSGMQYDLIPNEKRATLEKEAENQPAPEGKPNAQGKSSIGMIIAAAGAVYALTKS